MCAIAGSLFSILGALFTGMFSSLALMLATGFLFVFLAFAIRSQKPLPKIEKVCTLREKVARTAGIGAISGFISGFFGIGGGPILVPLLAYARQIPLKKAIPCSLAIIGIYAIPGSIAHYFLGNIDLAVFVPAAFGTIIGAQIGARMSIGIKEARMKRLFSLLLFLLGATLIINELLHLL